MESSYYYVCDLCGHFWSQEEPPSRCERCWSNSTWLIRMSTVEAAERRSERTRSGDRQGEYLHAADALDTRLIERFLSRSIHSGIARR